MRRHIEQALTNGSVPARKGPLQALAHEIRVEGRDDIEPWFRVPTGGEPKVRALVGSAPPAGLEPATRRLEVVGTGSRRVHWCRRRAGDQGFPFDWTAAAQSELRPQLRPRVTA